MIDKRSAIPYYEQLAELLRQEIGERGAQAEVYRLPSENDLAGRHGLSRATIRHALDVLEREGWVHRQKGIGSFAVRRRIEQDLTRLVSTTEDMRQRGWPLVSRVISLEQVTANPHIARSLELAEGASVYALCRMRIVEDVPLSVQTAYLPAQLCPHLGEADLANSLYHLLENRYGLRLQTARETLRARGANHWEAEHLQIREGAPVMATERITYASTGIPVEYLEAAWRGDRYDFKVTLTRPPT